MLSESNTPKEKAEAITSLIKEGYILSHKLSCERNYDDNYQLYQYTNYITDKDMTSLNKIKGDKMVYF